MGFGRMGHIKVTFVYLNITSANFQQDPYSHFEDYLGHRNRRINTNCSISIRLLRNNSNYGIERSIRNSAAKLNRMAGVCL